jgi:hypothetical protein
LGIVLEDRYATVSRRTGHVTAKVVATISDQQGREDHRQTQTPSHMHRLDHPVLPSRSAEAHHRFPVDLDRMDYVPMNLDTYPWGNLPGVKLVRAGGRVTIAGAGDREVHFTVVAEAGPHLLLRQN